MPGKAMQPFRTYTMADKVSWSIVAVPSQVWADKVFPDLPESKRFDALWDAIFKATRIDQDRSDPSLARTYQGAGQQS